MEVEQMCGKRIYTRLSHNFFLFLFPIPHMEIYVRNACPVAFSTRRRFKCLILLLSVEYSTIMSRNGKHGEKDA